MFIFIALSSHRLQACNSSTASDFPSGVQAIEEAYKDVSYIVDVIAQGAFH